MDRPSRPVEGGAADDGIGAESPTANSLAARLLCAVVATR